jgi:hypothetical protein
MYFRTFFLFLLFISFTGCFDLVEEVTLHSDGSGSFLFEANLSQSKTRLKTLMTLDSIDGLKIPSTDQLNKEMDKAKMTLTGSEGISHFKETRNFDDFIFSARFEFRNVAYLNAALAHLFKAFNPGVPAPENSYLFSDKTFTRKNEYSGKQEIKKIPRKELLLLENASLTCIYRFDQPVQGFSNQDAKLSKNGKALLLKLQIPDLLNGKKTVANTIKLQN